MIDEPTTEHVRVQLDPDDPNAMYLKAGERGGMVLSRQAARDVMANIASVLIGPGEALRLRHLMRDSDREVTKE